MSREEFEYLRQALEETNETVTGLAALIADYMNRTDKRFDEQDQMIQLLIDAQKQGNRELNADIQAIKNHLGMTDE